MKLWEIVKGMSEGKYSNDTIFNNSDMGDIIIYKRELLWRDDRLPVIVMLNDASEWEEELRNEN